MGNSNSKEGEKLFNWIQIEPHRYKNLVTNQIIVHQQVHLQSEDIIHAYNRRLKIVKPNIVQLVYYKKAIEGLTSCSQTPNTLDVYVEGGLSCLQQSLKNKSIDLNPKCFCAEIIKGFQELKSYFGPFQVQSNMVWVDQRNKVKVWGNKNYFLNQLISVSENLMVLQIRQILLKLNCFCNRFKDKNLSFKDFSTKIKEKKIFQRFHQSNCKDFNLRNTSLNQFVQHPFYYPEHYHQKKILLHTIKSPIHHSHTLNQNISNTEKSKTNQQSIHKKTQQTTIIHTTQQRKNHSEVLPTNHFSSSPKVYFQYQSQSVKQTPIKNFFQFRPYSQYNSPSQKKVTMKTQQNFSNITESEKKNRQNYNHSIVPSEKRIFFVNRSSQGLKKEQRESNYQRFDLNNQRQSINTLPFQLIQNSVGHYTYVRYSINGKQQGNTQQKGEKEREIKNSFKNNKIEQSSMNRGEINKNSLTDRSFQLKREKQREKNEQKSQNQIMKIEYQIPQKTKKLIQKYLSTKESYPNKQASKQSFPENQIKLRKAEGQSLKNQAYWIRDRSIKYFDGQPLERQPKDAKLIQFDKTMKQSNHQIQVKLFEENYESANPKREPHLQKNDREELKKEMEMIFNFAPQDEQQKNIKQKVAQKKAIFADLKKQAYKILDNSEV